MHYLLISFSHKNCDIKVREKLAFEEIDKHFYSKTLIEYHNINEVMILSTCNRVEVFASVKDCRSASEFIFKILNEHSKISQEELEGRAESYQDEGAIHHLFSVVSALDSLVIGESQIAGQVKDAFRYSYDNGFCSQKIVRAMHYAFKCAATIKNSTDISKNPVSIASIAVSKSKEIFGTLENRNAIVIGAGEMGRLATKHLISNGANVTLVNRNIERAKDLQNEITNIEIADFSMLVKLINNSDLLFCATGSTEFVIKKEMVQYVDFCRYWFDLSVPRNIEDVAGIDIFSVDDLKGIAQKNLSLREEQATMAYGIIGKFTIEFYHWLDSLSVNPTISYLRDLAKESSQKELKRAIKKGYIPAEYEESIKKVIHNSFKKFLHQPTVKLKEVAYKPEADTVLESIKYLFGEAKPLDKYKCEHIKN
jgi:glutamyl-tRNA reductase